MDYIDIKFFQQNCYDYIKTIGSGRFGIVFLVYSQQYQINLAIKKIPKNKFRLNEIQSMIDIRSPHITSLYQYYMYGESVYLVMEYCPESLDHIISDYENLSAERKLHIAHGLALSISTCHANGIAHGDIKPSNFLIDSYNRIKICDFGLAHKPSASDKSAMLTGTPLFFAPEVLNMQPHDEFAADIWSLGVSLYILMTGKYPWPTNNGYEMINCILRGQYDDSLIEDLHIRSIISQCLNLDPAQRPTASQVLKSVRKKIFNGKQKIIRPYLSNTIEFKGAKVIKRIKSILTI